MSVKFKNCIILATDENGNFSVLKHEVLCVENDKISYIGPDTDAPSCDSEKDMKGAVLMPGIVNAHCHGPMTLLRGVGSGLALQEWLETAIFPVEDKLKPIDIEAGEKLAVMEMLASGTTYVSEMYDFPWNSGKILSDTGIRANICRVGLAFSEETEIPKGRFDECVDLVKNWKDPYDRVRAEFCLHSEYLTNEIFVRKIAEVNKDLKKTVNVHVSETYREHEECKARHNGLTPIRYLEKCGILDNKTYAAHCVWVDEEDRRIMAEKGTSAIHNPSSNCKLASGFAPVKELLDSRVNVGLGTDGTASNNNLNMFEEMHLAAMLIKCVGKDATLGTAEDIIKMATVNGAKAMGRDDTGELKAGKKADIIAVSLDKPHMFPAFDIPNILVYSAQASDVIMTMVDGNILYENGEYKTIDKEKTMALVKESLERLY